MQDLQAHHKIRILCEDFGNIFSCQKEVNKFQKLGA